MSRPQRDGAATRMLGVRLTDDERKRYASLARSLGLSVSELVRKALEMLEKRHNRNK